MDLGEWSPSPIKGIRHSRNRILSSSSSQSSRSSPSPPPAKRPKRTTRKKRKVIHYRGLGLPAPRQSSQSTRSTPSNSQNSSVNDEIDVTGMSSQSCETRARISLAPQSPLRSFLFTPNQSVTSPSSINTPEPSNQMSEMYVNILLFTTKFLYISLCKK